MGILVFHGIPISLKPYPNINTPVQAATCMVYLNANIQPEILDLYANVPAPWNTMGRLVSFHLMNAQLCPGTMETDRSTVLAGGYCGSFFHFSKGSDGVNFSRQSLTLTAINGFLYLDVLRSWQIASNPYKTKVHPIKRSVFFLC